MGSNSSSVVISFSIAILLLLTLLLLISYNSKCKVENVERFENEKDNISQVLQNAYNIALNGRPGPVWIEVPLDLQLRKVRVNKFKNPLIVTKSHFKTFYNIQITNNELVFNINETDIQNLILQGYKDISEYMKTINNTDENINNDI